MNELIEKLDAIRDDAYWCLGCSDSDTLQNSLESIESQLAALIAELMAQQAEQVVEPSADTVRRSPEYRDLIIQHLDCLSKILDANRVMRAAGIEPGCFAEMFKSYSQIKPAHP